jgi:hypothetical protein
MTSCMVARSAAEPLDAVTWRDDEGRVHVGRTDNQFNEAELTKLYKLVIASKPRSTPKECGLISAADFCQDSAPGPLSGRYGAAISNPPHPDSWSVPLPSGD